MYLGVDYYPEQWDRNLIDQDLDNIVDLHCNIIRIADFAWNIIEPTEGVYDFSLFDEVIEKAGKRGLKVMMCIPTATMPRWLHKKYPEIMQQNEHGHPQPYGGRRGYCYNSEIYNQKAIQLTKAMGLHYRDNPTIVAWQLDNEIGHEGSDMCYCENCHRQFIQYLKEKYASIEELNQRWGTAFWAQSYDCFEDIVLPKKAYTAQNPSLRIEWLRFRSVSIERFITREYQALKEVAPQAMILHDFEGGTLEKHFDPFKVASVLDDVAYNNYPVWGGTVEPMKPWEVAFSLDCARGFKQDNFWITEEIMGAQGHDIIGCAIQPNQGSTWAMQSLAHGCKSFLIFRYRGDTKGAEQYCYGILDADNQKRRKYYEVQKLYETIGKYEEIFQSKIHAKAAILYDYDSASSFKIQQQSNNFNYVKECYKLHKQFYKRDVAVDIITKDVDFNQYEFLVVPYLIIASQSLKQRLKQFVQLGKTLVCTNKLAWKDEDNNLVFGARLPVGLDDLIGGVVEEQESLLAQQTRKVISKKGQHYQGEVFAEMMQATSAEVLMRYENNPFGDYGAVLKNHYGAGVCYYLATSLQEEGLDEVFNEILPKPIKEDLNIEIVERDGHRLTMDYRHFTYQID